MKKNLKALLNHCTTNSCVLCLTFIISSCDFSLTPDECQGWSSASCQPSQQRGQDIFDTASFRHWCFSCHKMIMTVQKASIKLLCFNRVRIAAVFSHCLFQRTVDFQQAATPCIYFSFWQVTFTFLLLCKTNTKLSENEKNQLVAQTPAFFERSSSEVLEDTQPFKT